MMSWFMATSAVEHHGCPSGVKTIITGAPLDNGREIVKILVPIYRLSIKDSEAISQKHPGFSVSVYASVKDTAVQGQALFEAF